MANILIIDDDSMLCDSVAAVIKSMGHTAEIAYTLQGGWDILQSREIQVVILDIWLPDGHGLQALPGIRDSKNAPEVIILTGVGDPDGAELAIKSGAWNYITKPPSMSKIKLPVQRAVEYQKRKSLEKAATKLNYHRRIYGSSRAIKACLDKVAQAARTESNVLITGETGTGKELFARAIHENSSRAEQPFVVVDCPTLPENLVESELFGHEKGAFTGADKRFEGLVKQADKGTLFLDEVGELPLAIQKSFLRVLQDHTFRSVGGVKLEKSNFRLVAATNRDLEEMIRNNEFRQDLFYRLQTMDIHLPPLRERLEDLTEICCRYIQEYCQSKGLERKGFAAEFLQALAHYDWPGNVRELMHAVECALAYAQDSNMLYPVHLPTNIRAQIARKTVSSNLGKNSHNPGSSFDAKNFPALKDFRARALAEIERGYLKELMLISRGDIKKACNLSGLSRARLYALLKEHSVSRQ